MATYDISSGHRLISTSKIYALGGLLIVDRDGVRTTQQVTEAIADAVHGRTLALVPNRLAVEIAVALEFPIRDNIQCGPDISQLNAVLLTGGVLNIVSNAPNIGGVKLPPATGSGKLLVVVNISNRDSAGATVIVFPSFGEFIGSNSVNTGQNCTLGRTNWYADISVGRWSSPLTV